MMKYIPRILENSVVLSFSENPVTAVLGPRQCGKSTLAKQLISQQEDSIFLDLEKPSDIQKLEDAEWFFTSQKGKLICLDEIQRKPDLFPVIRSLVDDWGGTGHFMILGSASRDLLRQSSETLAGRISYKYLSPFTWDEIRTAFSMETYLERGGFPRSLLSNTSGSSFAWREDFITTFLERDLRQWSGFLPGTMRRLWQILAHLNGQALNLSMIGSSLGVSHTTIRNYIDLLSDTFMVSLLPPYIANTGKRLVKSPKLYLTDTGIINALLGLKNFEQFFGHPSFGTSWEALVFSNIKAHFPDFTYFFYRTSHGSEIDIVIEISGKIIAIECKASVSPKLSQGTFPAIDDLHPVMTYIVSPINKGWPMREGIEVVSISELLTRLHTF
jgi:predicted AAA+ superfamily ATPase